MFHCCFVVIREIIVFLYLINSRKYVGIENKFFIFIGDNMIDFLVLKLQATKKKKNFLNFNLFFQVYSDLKVRVAQGFGHCSVQLFVFLY